MQHSIKGCVQSLCDWPHLILCCSHAYQEGTTEWLYIKVVTWLFLINRKEIPNYLFYDWNFTTEIEVRKLILIASEIAQGGQLPCPAGWCSLVLPPAQSHTPRHQARGIHLPVPLIQILLWSCIVALLHHSFAEYLNRNLEFLRFISSSMTTVSWIFAGQGQPAADDAHKAFPHTLFLFFHLTFNWKKSSGNISPREMRLTLKLLHS